MLRLAGNQVESLLDELLPVEVRELPAELAVLDRLLADPRLLTPIEQAWECSARGPGRAPGRWPARAASLPVGCLPRPGGWWIARGSSARRCGRSHGRWPGGPVSGAMR